MSIGLEEKLHGVAVLRLLEELSVEFPEARFSLQTGVSRSSYVLKGRLLKERRHLLLGVKADSDRVFHGTLYKAFDKTCVSMVVQLHPRTSR